MSIIRGIRHKVGKVGIFLLLIFDNKEYIEKSVILIRIQRTMINSNLHSSQLFPIYFHHNLYRNAILSTL